MAMVKRKLKKGGVPVKGVPEGPTLEEEYRRVMRMDNVVSTLRPSAYRPLRDAWMEVRDRAKAEGSEAILKVAQARWEARYLKSLGYSDLRGCNLGVWKGEEKLPENALIIEEDMILVKNETTKAKKAPEPKTAPRVTKSKAPKDAAPAKAKAAPKSKTVDGPKRPVGMKTGLGIQSAWAYVLNQNEKVPKVKKLSDEQITDWMKTEFPGRESNIFNQVQAVRNKYNKGGLTKGEIPAILSTRLEVAAPKTKAAAAPPVVKKKAKK